MKHHGTSRDRNEPAIVDALEDDGFSVTRIEKSKPAGFPDLHAARNGRDVLLEVKQPKGKLTPPQIAWRKRHFGRLVASVTTPQEALDEARRITTGEATHGE